MSTRSLTIALAGNPNVGKSTLFNALTGSRQHTGNWPGKTVEKKEGRLRLDGRDVAIVDLPGTYSLTAYSAEEIIARDFVLHERPDAVIAVADAANLERNLYLVTQLFELEAPVILALNMGDVARRRGLTLNPDRLSEQLQGTPVVETTGASGAGLEQLKAAIRGATAHGPVGGVRIPYQAGLERAIGALESSIQALPDLAAQYRPRWLAIRLLEADRDILEHLAGYPALLDEAEAARTSIETELDDDAETLIADGRYAFIQQAVRGALIRPSEAVVTRSEQLDRVLTHRVWGLPIFMLMMWIVFQFTANVSAPFVGWVEGIIAGPIAHGVAALFSVLGLSGSWIESLVIDGVIAGVGGVLVFVPVLLVLYLAIGVLEDSGYMARAAFVMDRVMRAMGLHGKSFLPMLVGFGCTVPAVYATRTLNHESDRRLTGFLVTFMSCGARLPIYVLMGAAFFGAQAGNLIFAMYLLGIVVALVTGWLVKRTVYRNQPPQPFVMELPPYRAPRVRDVWRQTRERTGEFVRKASTVILVTSIIVWLLMAVPATPNGQFNDVPPQDSAFAAVSATIAPVFAPAGFGNWQATGSLLSGLVAKEVIVGTMTQIMVSGGGEPAAVPEEAPTLAGDLRFTAESFMAAVAQTVQEIVNIVPRTLNLIPVVHMPEAQFATADTGAEDTTALEGALQSVFTPLAAVAFTVFVLLYTPCMSTLAALRHEFGGRFVGAQIAYTLIVAWVAAVIVFQAGTLLGFGS